MFLRLPVVPAGLVSPGRQKPELATFHFSLQFRVVAFHCSDPVIDGFTPTKVLEAKKKLSGDMEHGQTFRTGPTQRFCTSVDLEILHDNFRKSPS